jgi:uncharacterized protein (DUF4213/DUF364 family)
MINHTIDNVLDHCQGAKAVHVLGPTTGCLPDPLFARGVTTVGGRRVTEPNRFLQHWQQQSNWNDSAERYQISRADYPGALQLQDI